MKEYSITELQQLFLAEKMTSQEIVSLYLEQIERIDKQGPKINAILEINPEAMEQAKQLDEERQKGQLRGPLHGIPIILKDNIETKDKMMTTAGSIALENHYAAEDAFITKNLRDAGALILAKANLSEWANFRSTHSSSGWSSRGGQTKNPYVLDRTPCGSSSGSAAAVATNMCAAAIGTETDGSILCPSHINSVVGLKPTMGLLSRTGIIPIAHSQDIAGPIGRTVKDVAIILEALVGKNLQDPNDLSTMDKKKPLSSNYSQNLQTDALKGKRIGVSRNLFEINHHINPLLESTIHIIENLGAILIDPINMEIPEELGDAEYTALLYEFKTDLNKYLANLPSHLPVHSLQELIEFNLIHKNRTMPHFNQEILTMANEKDSLENEEYQKAMKKCDDLARIKGLEATFEKLKLDAIITPTGNPAWPIDHINGDHYTGASTSPAAIAGYPSITIPMGYVSNLPVGLSIISKKFTEAKLLGIAFALEQALKARKPPQFLPTI